MHIRLLSPVLIQFVSIIETNRSRPHAVCRMLHDRNRNAEVGPNGAGIRN